MSFKNSWKKWLHNLQNTHILVEYAKIILVNSIAHRLIWLWTFLLLWHLMNFKQKFIPSGLQIRQTIQIIMKKKLRKITFWLYILFTLCLSSKQKVTILCNYCEYSIFILIYNTQIVSITIYVPGAVCFHWLMLLFSSHSQEQWRWGWGVHKL